MTFILFSYSEHGRNVYIKEKENNMDEILGMWLVVLFYIIINDFNNRDRFKSLSKQIKELDSLVRRQDEKS